MRTLFEVVDYETENLIIADEFFSNDADTIFKKRYELEEAYQLNKKVWVCPVCRQPIKIRGKRDGLLSMHFAHIADNLDCPIKTGREYSEEQILCMKFNGQKESPKHYNLKNLIADHLRKDKRFSDIKVDKRLTGISKNWRKPDVFANYEGKNVAFELQLSTTFLKVIAGRNIFYKNNGIYIIWIFDDTKKNKDEMRFMENDIFYPNNHNAFFVNRDNGFSNFNLQCGYEKPVLVANSLEIIWQLDKVDFGDLTFTDDFRVYWYDFEKNKKQVLREIDEIEIAELGVIWQRLTSNQQKKDLLKEYDKIFLKFSIVVDTGELSILLDSLYSVKMKKVIGYQNFQKIVQVLHLYFESETNRPDKFGEIIFKAIKSYGAREIILQEDKKTKFWSRALEYKKLKLSTSNKYDKILKILFPEIIY